jgi:hypothetical protein
MADLAPVTAPSPLVRIRDLRLEASTQRGTAHILRGVSLLGVHSVEVPIALRRDLWAHLATDWRPPQLAAIHTGTVML